MTKLLEKAFQEASRPPEVDQNAWPSGLKDKERSTYGILSQS